MTTYPKSREGTDNIWEAMYTQRAIRYWEEREVPRDVILRVIEAATRAPSGSNLQPWRFVVVTSAETRRMIADAIRTGVGGASVTRRYGEATSTSQRLMMQGASNLFENFERAPVLIVPCLHHVTSPVTDSTTLLAGSSIYGAVQNLQLAARALGLGTVLTTVHARIDAQLREALAIPESVQPVALIPMGYPAANFGPTSRLPVEEVTYWEQWRAETGDSD